VAHTVRISLAEFINKSSIQHLNQHAEVLKTHTYIPTAFTLISQLGRNLKFQAEPSKSLIDCSGQIDEPSFSAHPHLSLTKKFFLETGTNYIEIVFHCDCRTFVNERSCSHILALFLRVHGLLRKDSSEVESTDLLIYQALQNFLSDTVDLQLTGLVIAPPWNRTPDLRWLSLEHLSAAGLYPLIPEKTSSLTSGMAKLGPNLTEALSADGLNEMIWNSLFLLFSDGHLRPWRDCLIPPLVNSVPTSVFNWVQTWEEFLIHDQKGPQDFPCQLYFALSTTAMQGKTYALFPIDQLQAFSLRNLDDLNLRLVLDSGIGKMIFSDSSGVGDCIPSFAGAYFPHTKTFSFSHLYRELKPLFAHLSRLGALPYSTESFHRSEDSVKSGKLLHALSFPSLDAVFQTVSFLEAQNVQFTSDFSVSQTSQKVVPLFRFSSKTQSLTLQSIEFVLPSEGRWLRTLSPSLPALLSKVLQDGLWAFAPEESRRLPSHDPVKRINDLRALRHRGLVFFAALQILKEGFSETLIRQIEEFLAKSLTRDDSETPLRSLISSKTINFFMTV
jgi:hypothetical protein